MIVYCGNRSQEIDTASIGFNDEGWREARDEFRNDYVYEWIDENGLEPTGWHYPIETRCRTVASVPSR